MSEYRNDNAIKTEEIEKSLVFVAGLIERQGNVYWPLFDRLEMELEQRKSRQDRLSNVLKIKDFE